MTIVFSLDQVYSHGGIEKVTTEKANYLANVPGLKVYLLTLAQKGKTPCYPLDEKVEIIDLNIRYNLAVPYAKPSNFKIIFQHFRVYKKILKHLQPDVLVSVNLTPDHFFLPWIKPKHTLLFKERHNTHYQEHYAYTKANWKGKIKFKLYDWLERKYDKIITLNETEASYVRTGNAVVIPNPIRIPESRASLDQKQVIAAGRIAPVKAFDELIKAWKIVNEQEPDWELHIYGPAYLNTQKDLEALVKTLHLEEKVKFKGAVDNLNDILVDYSIYTMSSEHECFPTVVLESLAAGIPVVSYDCPNGPRHIIKNKEDGLLIENKNQQALAEGILKLIKDKELRKEMGIKGKTNIKRFENEEVMKKWLNLLNLPNI